MLVVNHINTVPFVFELLVWMHMLRLLEWIKAVRFFVDNFRFNICNARSCYICGGWWWLDERKFSVHRLDIVTVANNSH